MAKSKKTKNDIEKLKYEVTQELGIQEGNRQKSDRKKIKNQ